MERLTKRTKTGGVLMAAEHEEKYTTEEWICMLQDRLADYEDSGVTPERVVWMKEVFEIAFDHDKSRAERAHELHVADKEGRVVVLPCKVGDTVWRIVRGREPHITWDEVRDMCFADDMTLCVELLGGRVTFTEKFGKTVFLSREEAEKALRETEAAK